MKLPKIYSKAKVSPVGQVNKKDLSSWFWGSVDYLKPFAVAIALMYLAPIMLVLGAQGHVVTINDFIPSEMTKGAIVLYIVSQIYGLLKKFADGSK